ncbi:hypothetical protein CERZMDRAFT_92487 [Cercospora zeae-maydis SCOH1-5]|uniref:Uncharacterized protein n=1 Tax=Cercospora zeae-maydis SCOH1-5 TaxID=717836 RepID=A0A6A6FWV3_9PEZI|nr:hypothetical protein CERZMDRAFT_92487 [Cercospora zeae-maydis SCOH1-5]
MKDVCFGRSKAGQYFPLSAELLEKRLVKRVTPLQDFSNSYLSDEHDRVPVAEELRQIGRGFMGGDDGGPHYASATSARMIFCPLAAAPAAINESAKIVHADGTDSMRQVTFSILQLCIAPFADACLQPKPSLATAVVFTQLASSSQPWRTVEHGFTPGV